MATKKNYREIFLQVLEGAPADRRIPFNEIVCMPEFSGVSAQTVKKHFKDFIDGNPGFLSRVTGVYPKPETIIQLVENEIGPVKESNLDTANKRCSDIVKGVARPIVEEFIRDGLSDYFDNETESVGVSLASLTDFLVEDFSDFVRGAGNGLVSIAGGLNEMLLVSAMENDGLVTGTHFTRTGKRSQGDIMIHSKSGIKANLAVEVKSYHARERLLRGLQDIPEPKVGAGFFKDPSEFNPHRTGDLVQAQPAAIYLPSATLSQLHAESRSTTVSQTAGYGSRLYRPLERFVTDMRGFYESGVLPQYRG